MARTSARKNDEPVPVTDRKLAALGKAYEKVRLQVKELEAEQEGYKKLILGELGRRGTKAIEAAGVKVTRVEQGMTSYSYDLLREAIGKRAGRYRKREVDVAALSRAVQSGDVPTDIIDQITITGTKAPYVSVSFTAL